MDAARILVIDDEPAVTRLCQRVLSREGFDVHSATNGAQGLQTFKRDNLLETIDQVASFGLWV